MRQLYAQWNRIDNKMPSEAITLHTQPEKPHHYMYLKEFRTQQCSLFLQHKCTQHRPFTCFHWHFLNQRRRRPIRRRDGTFNYSPDQYCTKYDETTGVCPDGDECPLLHRTAGDTERRYHLRYYKTGTCVYETDSRGHCVKNGPHCAFAHGAHDVRPPVYDIHEVQSSVEVEKQPNSTTSNGVEKEKVSAEDQKWNDTNYVLANYKTEQCKRPPRLCRQGYACPQYHNTRDRRRSPKKFKYRSTPCPNVKHGDEWGDPTQCENGDSCTYCHTRTEQQFHPEIYKSTKCNDMVQTGTCPRGPFCAFAHVEQEMTTQREVSSACENSLAAFVTSALPETASGGPGGEGSQMDRNGKYLKEQNGMNSPSPKLPDPIGKERSNSAANNSSQNSSPLPEPIGKGRSGSFCSDVSSSSPGPLQRAPGSEREDQAKLRQLLQAIDRDPSIDANEKNKRKQNLMMVHMPTHNGPHSAFPSYHTPLPMTTTSSMSPLAPAFYPPSDTVESVVGKALEELELDFDIACVDRDLERDNDTNSVSSTFSAGLSSSSLFGSVSGPIGIPGPGSQLQQRGSIGSLSQSPSSPFGSLHPPPQMLAPPMRSHEPIPEMASSPFFGRYNTPFNEVFSMSPHNGPHAPHNTPQNTPHNTPHNTHHNALPPNALPPNALPHSPQSHLIHSGRLDLPWEHENPGHLRSKLPEWEGFGQPKNTMPPMPPMHQQPMREPGGAGGPGGGPPFLQRRQPGGPSDAMPLPQLCQLRQQMLDNYNALDQIISQQAPKCLICQCQLHNVSVLPCKHQVFCPSCVTHATECPICRTAIQKASIPYTMQ